MGKASDPILPPDDPFAAYEPSEESPWSLPKAAHLLRRAAFGGSGAKLDEILKLSPGQAVDSLFDFDPKADPLSDMAERLEGLMNLDSPENVQRWWIYRMIHSPQPAQEKLALFWHNRFATSFTKVGNATWMAGQIDLFRRMGLGSFRELVIAVGRDPAMLVWLDGRDSKKGRPNENYAREVMELFTLGVGHYSENDVQELSRAFTGWKIQNGKGWRDPAQFDNGEKEVFGQTGPFDDESAVDLILRQPEAPRFLSKKLLREYVHPDPTEAMIDHYAQALRENNWEIKPVLKAMLASRMFFSDWAYRSKIKSPAELAIGGALAVGGKINVEFVRQSMNRMGQSVIFPPNVKGWDGGEAWINANTVLVRFNYGLTLATQREFARRTDVEAMLKDRGLSSAESIFDFYARVLHDGRLSDEDRKKMLIYMARNEKGELDNFKLSGSTVNSKVRGMIHLMMSMPEYQLV